MTFGERLLWASAIVLVDMVIFVLPLAAFFVAYLILARPSWFRDWVLELYTD